MHFFTGFDNERYCLDVNTSSVFSVDELTESLIKIQPNEELLEKYSIEEIRNAKETLNNFKEKGFLKKYDRKKPLLKNIHNTISLKGATLMVSSKCNLRCKYCFNDGGELPKDSLHSMSEKIAEDSIKFLIDNSEGNLGVSFFGGEPLMNWGIIKHITNICEQTERVWQFSMITNGTIMNEEIAEFLAKHKFHVVVSYEGILQDIQRPANDNTDKRELIRKNLKLLSKKLPQKDLSIICVLTNKTIPHIRSIVDEAKELGVRILFSPVTLSDNHYLNLTAKDIEKYEEVITNILDNEWLNNNIENFASVTSIRNTIFLAMKGKQRHYSCRLGCSLIGISATGDIYPCHRFIGVEEFKIGNINQGIDLQSYKKYAGRFVDNMEVCASCWARYFCGGGCAHDSYTYENDVLKPSSNRCELTRCEVELGLKYYADAMQKGNLKTLETLKDIIVYK